METQMDDTFLLRYITYFSALNLECSITVAIVVTQLTKIADFFSHLIWCCNYLVHLGSAVVASCQTSPTLPCMHTSFGLDTHKGFL